MMAPRGSLQCRPAATASLCGLLMCLVVAGAWSQENAGDPQAGYNRALRDASEQLRAGDTEQAIASLQALTARFPSRPEAFNNLAVLYARKGELERARDLLTRGMSTHPSYATTFQNLSEVLGQLAARAYDAALDNKAARPPPSLALIDTSAPVLAAATPAPAPAVTPRAPAADAARPAREPDSGPPPAAVAAPPKGITRSVPASPPPAGSERPGPDPRLAQVLATVNGWARAWSEQDVERYLDYYDTRFTPAKGLSRDAWRAQRRVRLTRPRRIEVEVRGPNVRLQGKDRATVRFRQRYRSNVLSSTVTKTLRLIKRGERWKILEERV